MFLAPLLPALTFLSVGPFNLISTPIHPPRCHTQPGDPDWPSPEEWSALNTSIGGRLVQVVPSASACAPDMLNCTEAQWSSANFRRGIPGQMLEYNWEQDFSVHPPELCLRNTTHCAQGNVPLYAVNATTVQHVQAGVAFAARHFLRTAVKSSGHDYLGRSTAKHALLLWTQYMKNITFTDAFSVGGKNTGAAATLGSGVGLREIYAAAGERGQVVVGGTAATVSVGGDYVQGAGHSGLSPFLGLAADNVLQFEIVLADGSAVVVNEVSHPDLFWALRGGGAGNWGVITSITIRTFPAFLTTLHSVNISFASYAQAAHAMRTHAEHIGDWDAARAGQYFYLSVAPSMGPEASVLLLNTVFPNATADVASALVKPFVDDVLALGASILAEGTVSAALPGAILGLPDDVGGTGTLMGSRLIPAEVYASEEGRTEVERAYVELLELGVPSILGHLVAGGKVAENAHVHSAIHPGWRTAKTHMIAVQNLPETFTPSGVENAWNMITHRAVPVLARLAASSSIDGNAAYSNEADVREPDFQAVFYGRANYARLEAVKRRYDPTDMWIVRAGVGSERWNEDGMCAL
ncbi:FAD-binding domain-containing protein [Amylostereum chailletii]|nr:FAD-binding domain-containing protein [Amylostereum chailletii]